MYFRLWVISGPLMLPGVSWPCLPWTIYIKIHYTKYMYSGRWNSWSFIILRCNFVSLLCLYFLFESKYNWVFHINKVIKLASPCVNVVRYCFNPFVACISRSLSSPGQTLLHITFQKDVIIPTIPHMEPVTEWHSPQRNQSAWLATLYNHMPSTVY